LETPLSTDPVAEVIVVDNHSADGSPEYLQTRFSRVRFIFNPENLGYGRANNLGLKHASGRYILFLNPDTILAEDSLVKCLGFLESHPGSGAMGVRMIDGHGEFLRESMRGFPSPWVAFCKMSGLTTLFPRSRWFARYYLGHLDPGMEHSVDVLSGAFMMIKKEALDKTGGFDERFFMYAEDIDLSERIRQAGFRNYYYPGTSIIHFKGESTRKDAGYVRQFYKAMIQFMHKHGSGGSRFMMICMEMGIRLSSGMSALFHGSRRDTNTQDAKQIKSWITGDEQSIREIKSVLAISQRSCVEKKEDATEIIFCEGPGFSFGEIIVSLQKNNASSYRIHGLGSTSMVGSDSKKFPGEAFGW